MEISQKVTSDSYPEYGKDMIISKRKILDKEFFNVLFGNIGKIIKFQKNDLKKTESLQKILKSGAFSSIEFKLNLLAHSLEAMASKEKALSPANSKIDFVFHQFKLRCFLDDEASLGKAIEAALIIEELKKEKTQRMLELKKQFHLFPGIECFQITKIKFR